MDKASLVGRLESLEKILNMNHEEYEEHRKKEYGTSIDGKDVYACRTGEVSALITLLIIEVKHELHCN